MKWHIEPNPYFAFASIMSFFISLGFLLLIKDLSGVLLFFPISFLLGITSMSYGSLYIDGVKQ